MACKDCTKRHVGCHAECEEYKNDIAKRKEKAEKIRKAKEQENMLNRREFERIEKAKKKKGEIK